jgi:hypothetical protein
MSEAAGDLADRLAVWVGATMPSIVARVPATPAAELGRLGAGAELMLPLLHLLPPQAGRRLAPVAGPLGAGPVPARASFVAQPVVAQPARLPTRAPALAAGVAPMAAAGMHPLAAGMHPGETVALNALRELHPLLVERLLGALELTVAGLDLTGAPGPSATPAGPAGGSFGIVTSGHEPEAVAAATILGHLAPDIPGLVDAVSERLTRDPAIAPLLAVPSELTDETSIAARHGARHLALAVAVAAAVVGRADLAGPFRSAAAVVGVGLGVAASLLSRVPMPGGYRAAVVAAIRENYLMPRASSGRVSVFGHCFALLEGGTGGPVDLPDDLDFSGNGLVVAVPGGVAIRTGLAEGSVRVDVRVVDKAPEPDPVWDPLWDEIVELTWHAGEGLASVTGPHAPADSQLCTVTPPWPGDYRLRVQARGRDDADESEVYSHSEAYELVIWRAPAAPEVVLATRDRLGSRLRGEPEAMRPEPPEEAYRWVRKSRLREAATITVVTGAGPEEVLEAFGADPGRPESARQIAEELLGAGSLDPWVQVIALDGAVVAVEDNGWQGAGRTVLRAASVRGRAASMYWNVNALTRLSFAEGGELIDSFELGAHAGDDPRVRAALAELDFEDLRGDRVRKGLVAVERFTGHRVTEDHLARIDAAGVGFRIVPHLPEQYPYQPWPEDTLVPSGLPCRPLLDRAGQLTALPADRARELAWWIAAETARLAGLADDPDVATGLAARALTGATLWRARRSQLQGGEHRWLWLALHGATNPDPVAAVLDAVDAGCYALGARAAELVERSSQRLAAPADDPGGSGA